MLLKKQGNVANSFLKYFSRKIKNRNNCRKSHIKNPKNKFDNVHFGLTKNRQWG